MKALPLIVSYYTVGTVYEPLAARLRASCVRHGLDHRIEPRPSRGSWEANTFAKADVCREVWQQCGRPILWVDADAVMHGRPDLLRGVKADFAVHKWKGDHFASGTVFFNQTPAAGRLLDSWVELCGTNHGASDQPHLQRAWEIMTALEPVKTLWLPRAYCQIFDAKLDQGQRPVIEHFQASRTQLKRKEAVA